MKNHFDRAGLAPDASDETLDAMSGALADDRADIEAAGEILRDAERRTHYRRVHLQYRALAAALDALDAPIARDSHRWRERLIEFAEDAAPRAARARSTRNPTTDPDGETTDPTERADDR